MTHSTILAGLTDSIDELTKVLHTTNDVDQKFQLRLNITKLFRSLDKIVLAESTVSSPTFDNAIGALNSLSIKAMEASQDIDQIQSLINKSAEVIEQVENIANGVSGILDKS